MIRVAYLSPDEGVLVGARELIDTYDKATDGFLWVDMESVDKDTERKILLDHFSINELVINDAQRDRHPPKFENFNDYFFLLMKAFNAETDSIDFGILHISFFVGINFIITRRDGVSPSINKTWKLVTEDSTGREFSPQYICYRVVCTIVERYTPVVLSMEKRLEELEEIMLAQPTDSILAELIRCNSALKKLRRIFAYQENIIIELLKTKNILEDDERRHEFNNIYEQMERLASLSGLYQELTRDLMDGYISVTSHHLNQVMKVLTIASVIFLPLTFLAGIYGMNFQNMPVLSIESAYFIVLGVMGALAVAMVSLFKYLKWI